MTMAKDVMLPEWNACRAEAGEAATLNPSVQQMSLFTGLKGLCASEWTTTLALSLPFVRVYIWFAFILCKKDRKGGEIN